MSPAERERFLVRVLDSLSDPIAAAELADANARADEAATRADSAAARADSAMTALRATPSPSSMRAASRAPKTSTPA